MSEEINLDSIAIIYDGDYVSSVPNTYKAFLELLRNTAGMTNEDFNKKTIWRGDFPITCKKDYIKAIRKGKDEGIMQIDLVSNELDEKEGITEKDYLQFLELKEPEEAIKINVVEEESKEETIYIESNVNEFYAITQVTQYYKNNNNKPVELSIIYPLRKEINFKKFTINIDGKKSFSKIFEKEKANEKYSDALASGNVGIISKYAEEDPNAYSITIGNVAPNVMIELTSEFIQFISSDDMSFCYSVMTNYPTFSDGISRNYLKNVSGKITLKTHSKITRLVNQNFTIDKYFKRVFNNDNTQCDIEFKILNDSKNYNSILNVLFRTEKMNEPYLLSQYNPEKDETSYIFGMIYDQKDIPIPESPDTDININYYEKYQINEKTDTPSLFIFLIDQSGSMAGSSMRLVSESLLFFLQSLPKDSYFQLIGFGSTFKKINEKPLFYNKENVKSTMDIVKNLKADLGGTNISSPLKDIFNSKDYDDIKLGRNLFILTDGEVDDREECLELISINSDKFKVHAIGIGSSFDKILIRNAGIQGRGSYNFVTNISQINSIIIQSLSKCLRNYLLDVKLRVDKAILEYEFLPKFNFIYPDEILNYYFIIKGNNDKNENIQITFESLKKNENYIFPNDKIIKEENGEIIGQIIIGNLLKSSDNNLDENVEIKLSKNYQVLSKKTSLFAIAEGEESNKIAEFKQVKKKEKPKNNLNFLNMNFNENNNNYNILNNYNNVKSLNSLNNNNLNNLNMNFNENNNNNNFFNNYNSVNRNNSFNNNLNNNMNNNLNNNYQNNNNYYMLNNNNLNNNFNNYNNYNMLNNNNHLNNNLQNNNNNYNSLNNNFNNYHSNNIVYIKSEQNNRNNDMEEEDDAMPLEMENRRRNNYNRNAHNDMFLACMRPNRNIERNYMVGSAAPDNDSDNDEEEYNNKEILNKDINYEGEELKEKEEKESSKKESLNIKKNVEFSNKDLILTQDIVEGSWNLNEQTNLLIEKLKLVYEKVGKYLTNKNLDNEEIKTTLLVLYYLNTDSSINKIEFSLIIKKGLGFVEKNGINFDEFMTYMKN